MTIFRRTSEPSQLGGTITRRHGSQLRITPDRDGADLFARQRALDWFGARPGQVVIVETAAEGIAGTITAITSDGTLDVELRGPLLAPAERVVLRSTRLGATR
jgi:hypothetical protein